MDPVTPNIPGITALAESFQTRVLGTCVAVLVLACAFLFVMLVRSWKAHIKTLEAHAPQTAQLISLTNELKHLLRDYLRDTED